MKFPGNIFLTTSEEQDTETSLRPETTLAHHTKTRCKTPEMEIDEQQPHILLH